jgi:hypothetical protein
MLTALGVYIQMYRPSLRRIEPGSPACQPTALTTRSDPRPMYPFSRMLMTLGPMIWPVLRTEVSFWDETGQCHWRIIAVFPFGNFNAYWFLYVIHFIYLYLLWQLWARLAQWLAVWTSDWKVDGSIMETRIGQWPYFEPHNLNWFGGVSVMWPAAPNMLRCVWA